MALNSFEKKRKMIT